MAQTIPLFYDKINVIGDFDASSDNFSSLLSNSKKAPVKSTMANSAQRRLKLDSKSINYFGYNLSGGSDHTKPSTKSSSYINLLANNSTNSLTNLLSGRKNKSAFKRNANVLLSNSQFFKPVGSQAITKNTSILEQESFIITSTKPQINLSPPSTKTIQKYAIERQSINHFSNSNEDASSKTSAGYFRPKSNKNTSKQMICKILNGDLENEPISPDQLAANLFNSNSQVNFYSASTNSVGSDKAKTREKNNKVNVSVLSIFF